MNLRVNPEVHNIFIKRIGFTLIRVHRQQTINADQSQAEVLLQQLKWPIERIEVGMKIKDYNSTDVALRRQHLDKWHTFSQVSSTSRATQGWRQGKLSLKNSAFSVPASVLNNNGTSTAQLRLTKDAAVSDGANVFEGLVAGDIVVLPLTGPTGGNTGDVPVDTTVAVTADVTLTLEVAEVVPDTATVKGYVAFKQLVSDVENLTGFSTLTDDVGLVTVTATVYRVDSAEATATVATSVNTLDSLTIKAHGIPIYNGFKSQFYNAYLPYHYGGPNVKVPEDRGLMFIPFNLYPGTYQPSGHINVSRAREFYLEYTSSVISPSNVGTLVVNAEAINFLLISDGSAVLRYST